MMEINIKLKFDKSSRPSLWNASQRPFFLDASRLKHHEYSPDCQLHSFREPREYAPVDDKQPLLTHRETSRDAHRQKPKQPSTKKSVKNKTVKPPSSMLSERGSTHQRKSLHEKPKPKKIASQIHLPEEETLRDSLPGLSGKKVLQRFAPLLSEHQKVQLSAEKVVYYIGVGTVAGEDDGEGSYLWRKHEQIGYRYQLLERLGSGAFGEVIRAYDHKNKEAVAIKIIKARSEHMQLALNEINILMKIKERDIQNRRNILRIKDFIVFRKHICIITQILSISLYELLEANKFQPLDVRHIRSFSLQILSSLAFLKEEGIIHSDLKPENILLKSLSKVGLKVIDFGTSMFANETNFLYIQSRFYRAPEIILGCEYSHPIDMWSFGCLLAELYLGQPLFAGENEQEQLSLILQTVGVPKKDYLRNCKNSAKYFQKDFLPKIIKTKDGKTLIPKAKPLESFIPDRELCALLNRMLTLDPSDRMTPLEALADPWVLASLSDKIRNDHLSQIVLKIRKEEETKVKKEVGEFKRHKKRNSELHRGSSTGHRRRGSEGLV